MIDKNPHGGNDELGADVAFTEEFLVHGAFPARWYTISWEQAKIATFLPSKVIGELNSGRILAEWEGMSTSID